MPKLDLSRTLAAKYDAYPGAPLNLSKFKGPGFEWPIPTSSPSWEPLDHWDDIMGWYEAQSIEQFVLTPDTTLVETWYDFTDVRPLSSNNTPRPARNGDINGHPAVRFNGNAANRLDFDGGLNNINFTNYTIFAVIKPNATADYDRIFTARQSTTGTGDAASPNVIFGYRDSNTSGEYPFISRPAGTKSSIATGSNTGFVFHARYDGTNVISGINGVETSPVAASAPGIMRFLRMGALAGANNSGSYPAAATTGNFDGDIGEVYLLRTSIDPVFPVETYFAPRWSITI